MNLFSPLSVWKQNMLYKFDRERNIILNMLLKFKKLIQRKIFNYFGKKQQKFRGIEIMQLSWIPILNDLYTSQNTLVDGSKGEVLIVSFKMIRDHKKESLPTNKRLKLVKGNGVGGEKIRINNLILIEIPYIYLIYCSYSTSS